MGKAELSIVIAIYNGDQYLRACLESIKACPSKTMECIMVNDGSTDGTRRICEEFADSDSRFFLINKENTGVSDSRNTGLQKAEGNYIFFIDADDYLDSEQWPVILEDARKGQYDMVAYSYYTLFESGKTQKETFPIQGNVAAGAEDTQRVLLTTSLLNTCWAKLLKREVIEKNRLSFRKELKTGEDAIFMIDFIDNASTFFLCNMCVLYYRQHGGSAMRRMDISAKLDDFRELFVRRNAYLEHHPDYVRQFEMYRRSFSVITDLLLKCAEQNNIKNSKEAYKSALQKQVVTDILSGTDQKTLSPAFKKLEYALMRGGCTGLLALYFMVKAKFSKKLAS